MKIINRIWNGSYSLPVFLGVVSIATGFIAGGAVYFQGWITYHGLESIPGVTHISETFFTGLLITLITGICLHWHANRKGKCLTLAMKKRCPFLGLLFLGLALGGIATVMVFVLQGSGQIPLQELLKAKGLQGFITGLSLPFFMQFFTLLRHPQIRGNENQKIPIKEYEKTGSVKRYLFNLCGVTMLLNLFLFPGIAWVFYHSKEFIDLAVVHSEVFFGGMICTIIVGITGHFEAAKGEGGCLTCRYRNACPFLGIFILGIAFGILCIITSLFSLSGNDLSFKGLMILKMIQGVFLGFAIPLAMVKLKLLLHPDVNHPLQISQKGI